MNLEQFEKALNLSGTFAVCHLCIEKKVSPIHLLRPKVGVSGEIESMVCPDCGHSYPVSSIHENACIA